MSNIYWEEHNRPSDDIPSKETTISFVCELPKKTVGRYDITGNHGGANSVMFMLTKKPKWFHRTFTRFFLGWRWVDEK